MARVIISYIYPPIPDRRFDFQAYYDGEEDEQMDVGFGSTAKEARFDLLDNYPRDFNLGDFLLDLSPFIIVAYEGGRYARVSPWDWIAFIFRPAKDKRWWRHKCMAAFEIPYLGKAVGYDFILARMGYDPWRLTNKLVEYL